MGIIIIIIINGGVEKFCDLKIRNFFSIYVNKFCFTHRKIYIIRKCNCFKYFNNSCIRKFISLLQLLNLFKMYFENLSKFNIKIIIKQIRLACYMNPMLFFFY